MRISDWSSDVCSSDLAGGADRHQAAAAAALLQFLRGGGDDARAGGGEGVAGGQRGAVDVALRRVDAAERRIQAEPGLAVILSLQRSEGRRVGKECVSTCRHRCSPYHYKKNKKQ